MILSILYILFGVVFSFIGLYIWKSNKYYLIKGYDLSTIKDREGLSKWFGKCIIFFGSTVLLIGIISLIFFKYDNILIVCSLIIMIFSKIGLSIIFVGVEKYKK